MVNFKLDETNVKMNSSTCYGVGQRKNLNSRQEFEPMTSQTPGGRFIHLSYGELRESEAIY